MVGATFAALWLLEARRPLRASVEPRGRRTLRNAVIAAAGGLTVALLQTPVVGPLSQQVVARRWGLLQRARLPAGVETVLAVLLLDYTLYLWHRLTHRVPFLWAAHRVHHADRDMDTTTALRFHFVEMALSVPWRAAQVGLLGVSPRALALWQSGLLVSILFHHSNLRLPERVERWLSWGVVTPRLHGIHHSTVEAERDSNWSSGLTVWDVLHGTLRRDVPPGALTMGVPELPEAGDVTLGRMLALPFSWHNTDP